MKKGGVLLWALVGLCAWHLALRWHGFYLPMISDEGEYAYQARLLSEGGVPYRDAYNQKPPGVFFIYRVSYALLGGRDWAPRASAVLFSWLTMVFLFLLSPPAWSRSARLTAPAVYATLSTQPVGDMGFAANTEVFLAAFTAMGAWCLKRSWRGAWRGWPVLAGLACGAAVMTKQTALWSLLAFGGTGVLLRRDSTENDEAAAVFRWREALRRAGLYVAGCAVIPGLTYLYFGLRGASRELLEQVLWRNMDYAAILVRSGAWRDQLEWFLRTA
ncbi:MAG: glycosyltransferase family 39 protein, partial [Elusimicrobia bacterium]|nr:glycosyltransferase family 39 protein [Elusimicrobiota bacterium]